jgi:hypothetical protein
LLSLFSKLFHRKGTLRVELRGSKMTGTLDAGMVTTQKEGQEYTISAPGQVHTPSSPGQVIKDEGRLNPNASDDRQGGMHVEYAMGE